GAAVLDVRLEVLLAAVRLHAVAVGEAGVARRDDAHAAGARLARVRDVARGAALPAVLQRVELRLAAVRGVVVAVREVRLARRELGLAPVERRAVAVRISSPARAHLATALRARAAGVGEGAGVATAPAARRRSEGVRLTAILRVPVAVAAARGAVLHHITDLQ